jgi:hypothetical protein
MQVFLALYEEGKPEPRASQFSRAPQAIMLFL